MRRFFCTFRSECGALVVTSLLLGAGGCLPRGSDEASRFEPAPLSLAHVDFSTLKATVLTPHCILCHEEFFTEAGLQPFVVPGQPSRSSLYTDIAGASMPPDGPPLSAGSLDLVATYINGLPTTTAGAAASPPPP